MTRSRELAELATAYDTGTPLGMRNRIINGDMRIHQRGGNVTLGGGYPVDRFQALRSGGAATMTASQSTVAPAGFTHSLLYQVGTAAAPGAGEFSGLMHHIEGFNVADLGWGTANAQPVTVSFRVRSSVTGTFAFGLRNSAGDRSYIASFTVDAADTYETKSVTIPGDTSGTWLTNNGIGITMIVDLGVGSNNSTTAGSWQAGNFFGLTGGTKLITTAGATFYITGVQLEAGSVATPFERRPYGTEWSLCTRYYQRNIKLYAAVNSAVINFSEMRASPTATRIGIAVTGSENVPALTIDSNAIYAFNASTPIGGTYTLSAEL